MKLFCHQLYSSSSPVDNAGVSKNDISNFVDFVAAVRLSKVRKVASALAEVPVHAAVS